MTTSSVWERAAKGLSSVALGQRSLVAPRALPLTVVRVACDGPRATFGPILAATQRLEALLGEPAPLLDQARRGALDLGRRILGETGPTRGPRAALAEAASRLAKLGGGHTLLVFDAVDDADDATLTALAALVADASLRLPLALCFRSLEPTGRAAELLRAARAAWGEEAISRAEAPAVPAAPALDLAALPDGVRTILRCAAVLGPTFELEVLAQVLRSDVDQVLVALQTARDRGVPIEDREDGLLSLPTALAETLRDGTLSALRARWHARAGHVLAEGEPKPEVPAPTPPSAAAPNPPPPAPRPPLPTIPPETSRSTEDSSPAPPPPSALEDFAPSRTVTDPVMPPEEPPAPVLDEPTLEAARPPSYEEPVRVVDPPPAQHRPAHGREMPASPGYEPGGAPPAPPHEPVAPTIPASRGSRVPIRTARPRVAAPEEASEHFLEAGEVGLAIREMIDGAEHACSLGAHTEAQGQAHRALEMLRRVPRSSAARELELRALAALGRVHLDGIGASGFDLATAIEKLEAAKGLLAPTDPPELHVLVAELLATAHYEVGDLPSLERALEELTLATRALLAGRHAHHAARLLNDQAAVYIRMGDPVRAMSLLSESRRIYEDRAATDEIARREMAQTDHLIAAVPLHVPPKPGRGDDALSSALDHAKAALRTYERMGAPVQAARVRETMGRLELRRGRPERALEHLQAALKVEQRYGDVIGLARASAAFAELLAGAGRHRDALLLLGESISLNRRKGSAIGVAFNRRTLGALARTFAAEPQTRPLLRELEGVLAEAEAEVGRIALPGEREAP